MEGKTLAGFGIGLIAGAIIGGVIALLYAPQSGKKTRQLIKDKATEVVDTVKEETGEVKDKVTKFVDEVKEETSGVVDTVEEAVSGANRKSKAVVKTIKS